MYSVRNKLLSLFLSTKPREIIRRARLSVDGVLMRGESPLHNVHVVVRHRDEIRILIKVNANPLEAVSVLDERQLFLSGDVDHLENHRRGVLVVLEVASGRGHCSFFIDSQVSHVTRYFLHCSWTHLQEICEINTQQSSSRH